MSARVNLLPREIEERARARRTTGWVIGGVAAYAALLGLLYIGKLGRVADAEERRDGAQAEVAQLEGELAELQQYAELDRQVAARTELLTAAMATQISWARVLNDLALTFPPSSSMVTFVATAQGAGEAGAVGATTPLNSESVGTANFDGYSTDSFAPGVERVLVKFDEVETYFNAYLTEATDVERGGTAVTSFSGTFQLNDEAYSRRYAQGLPPEVGR